MGYSGNVPAGIRVLGGSISCSDCCDAIDCHLFCSEAGRPAHKEGVEVVVAPYEAAVDASLPIHCRWSLVQLKPT